GLFSEPLHADEWLAVRALEPLSLV
ncbi:MAG: hypothetical protein RLZZ515_942, partial [Cyanobacteriota bacterium]